MPFVGASFSRTDGTRTGSQVWTDALDAGVTINAADADTHDQDLADGLELCLRIGGENSPTATIDFNGQDLTGVADLDINSTSSGAVVGPTLTLDRNSASPAASDILGGVLFDGRDDSAAQTTYAQIQGKILDPTNGSEDGQLEFQVLAAGAVTTPVTVKANALSIVSTDAGATANPFFEFYRNSASPADSDQLGQFDFLGNDDGLNSTAYASIYAEALDVTDGTEDGQLKLKTMVAGTATLLATLDGNGLDILTGDLRKSSVDYPYQPAPQTSTSGTSIDFTGLPSWAKKITIGFRGVSLNSTSDLLVQIGDSGGIETSGYESSGTHSNGAGTSTTTSTAGFPIRLQNAGRAAYAIMTLVLIDGPNFVWGSSHSGHIDTLNAGCFGGGGKILSDVLDRVRITTVSGSDTFDAGKITIITE